MRYVVSLSGGMASAIAADRAIERYGADAVHLWFANVKWEDSDLYRFVAQCLGRWGKPLEVFTEGRTPLEVASDEHIIPNQKIAPCTHRLKIEPFGRWVESQPKPLTVLIGMKWSEQHRMKVPRERYGALPGVSVDFPLMWAPIDYRPEEETVRSWGITPPRLYRLGFPHNNCGGRCVKQGIGEWDRLRLHFPERFAEVRDWEANQRAKGLPWSNYAIARDQSGAEVKPLTLAEIEERGTPKPGQPVQEDMFSCFCEAA